MRHHIQGLSLMAIVVSLVAFTTPSASAQIIVDGQSQTVVIDGSPGDSPGYARLERAHRSAYDPRARIITKASVTPPAAAPIGAAAPVFRLDPWSERRYAVTWSGYPARYRYTGYGYRWYGYGPSCYYGRGIGAGPYVSYSGRCAGYGYVPAYYGYCGTPYSTAGARIRIRID